MSVGLKDWSFDMNALPAQNSAWRYMVLDMAGRDGEPAWDLNPDYQRPACWTEDQQELFIGHVLEGGLVPPIYIQRSNYDSAVEVIDGQQRLRAIRAFMSGDLQARVYHHNKWHRLPYGHLSTEEKRSPLLASKLIFVNLPREERLKFYLRLNSAGTAHTQSELDRVRKMLLQEERPTRTCGLP
jgi:hypothetical protein